MRVNVTSSLAAQAVLQIARGALYIEMENVLSSLESCCKCSMILINQFSETQPEAGTAEELERNNSAIPQSYESKNLLCGK